MGGVDSGVMNITRTEGLAGGGLGLRPTQVVSENSTSSGLSNWLQKIQENKNWKFYLAVATTVALTAIGTTWVYKAAFSSSANADSNEKKIEANKLSKSSQNQDRSKEKRFMGLSVDEIKGLSEEERQEAAQKLKEYGNDSFRLKDYEQARNIYSKALQYHQDAIFYCNRAACSSILKDYEQVIQDCHLALDIDRYYVKAIIRRGNAYEAMDLLKEALEDFSAACLLSNFGDKTAAQRMENVLMALSQREATEISIDRTIPFASHTFVDAFLKSFQPSEDEQKVLQMPKNNELSEGDQLYKKALHHLADKQYEEALKKVEQSINVKEEKENRSYLAQAYNLRGTLRFLRRQLEDAIQDFNDSIDLKSDYVQSYVKLSSVYLELGEVSMALDMIDGAKKADDRNADVYYHLGQIKFISGEYLEGVQLYQKAIHYNPNSIFPYIQLGVCEYKSGLVTKARQTYDQAMKEFPDNADIINYYAELLLDVGDFNLAVKYLDDCLQLDSCFVLAHVNKAIYYLNVDRDFDKAINSCNLALECDPRSDVALSTLAQVYIQNKQIREAVEVFQRCIESARSDVELINAISYKESALAQLRVFENYPELINYLDQKQPAPPSEPYSQQQ